MLPLDEELTQTLRNLDPHKSAFELDKPFTVSGNLSMPKTVVATISNWLDSPITADKEINHEFMASLSQ